MAQLRINNINTGAKIYALQVPAGQQIADLVDVGKNDGLDQIYFQIEDRLYLAEGDGLDFSGINKGLFPTMELFEKDGGREFARVIAVDNEVNTATEGAKNVLAVVGASVGLGVTGGGIMGARAMSRVAPGIQSVKQGSQLLNTGFKTLSGTQASQGSLLGSIGNRIFKGIPSRVKGAVHGTHMMDQGARQVVSGVDLTVKGAQEGRHLLKKGAYAVGAGLAVGTVVLGGGALYGANRNETPNKLAPYRTEL